MTLKFSNTYGFYDWNPSLPKERDRIHPEDLHNLTYEVLYHSLVHCIGYDKEYLLLKYGSLNFRGKPSGDFLMTENVSLYMNDTVRRKGSFPEVIGKVYRVAWHFKREVPLYFIEINGKKKRTWYLSEDLELVEKAERGMDRS